MGFPNAEDGFFLVGYHKTSPIHKKMLKDGPENWISQKGVMATSFPVGATTHKPGLFELRGNVVFISEDFNKGKKPSPFENSGICVQGKIVTLKTAPKNIDSPATLSSILQNGEVGPEFFIPEEDLPQWEYLKGGKKEIRTTKEGFQYHYTEGAMTFPDALDKPSRTIITGEGGKSPSRFKHVVQTSRGLRRLTPIELERLNGFPDNHTQLDGISNGKRAFFMGNALVVGIVKKIGEALVSHIEMDN